jgi:hypothetical protein
VQPTKRFFVVGENLTSCAPLPWPQSVAICARWFSNESESVS